jgi:hypothetical protein
MRCIVTSYLDQPTACPPATAQRPAPASPMTSTSIPTKHKPGPPMNALSADLAGTPDSAQATRRQAHRRCRSLGRLARRINTRQRRRRRRPADTQSTAPQQRTGSRPAHRGRARFRLGHRNQRLGPIHLVPTLAISIQGDTGPGPMQTAATLAGEEARPGRGLVVDLGQRAQSWRVKVSSRSASAPGRSP